MSNTALLGSYGDNSGTGLMFRNRIINGDMRIDQRNAGASSSTADETYTLDRWSIRKIGAGNFSVQQRTTQSGATNFEAGSAPTGFTHSIKVTTTTQDNVMDTSDVYGLVHSFEGLNVGDLGWGTSSPQTVTLSFWVKSSFAGVYGIGFNNPLTDAGYSVLYTINAANTWEYKTITITGPTFGTFKTDNTAAFRINWSIGCGSGRLTTPNSWVASNSAGAVGQVNLISQSAGATFYLTGVQLEAGPTATPFERRPYGVELGMCQRYYERGNTIVFATSEAATSIYLAGTANFKVSKRVSPTGLSTTDAVGNAGRYSDFSVANDTVTNNVNVAAIIPVDQNTARLRYTYQPGSAAKNNLFCYWAADAEL